MESLVALTICALAMLAAMHTMMVTTNNTARLKQNTLARISAENTINKHLLTPINVVGSSKVDCSQGSLIFTCVSKVSKTPHPKFLWIKVMVFGENNEILSQQITFKNIIDR